MAEYVERKALIEDIDAAMDCDGMGYVVGQTMKRYIKRQPAADVAPVRHGRWIHREYDEADDSDEYYYCSECHEIALAEFGRYTYVLSDYCPNCGALMQEVLDGKK